jgi:hypothetical protein
MLAQPVVPMIIYGYVAHLFLQDDVQGAHCFKRLGCANLAQLGLNDGGSVQPAGL